MKRAHEADGPTVFAHACKMGLEGIVSKRKNSTIPLGTVTRLGQVQELGVRGGTAKGGGGIGRDDGATGQSLKDSVTLAGIPKRPVMIAEKQEPDEGAENAKRRTSDVLALTLYSLVAILLMLAYAYVPA